VSRFNADVERAENRERSEAMLREQLSKRSGEYIFTVRSVTAGGALPLLSASTINSMRRLLASDIPAWTPSAYAAPAVASEAANSLVHSNFADSTLMRTRYCVRYELGLCPKYQHAAPTGPLFLVNNGRRLALGFDCAACEMTVIVRCAP
jgi:putative protease